MRTDCMHVPVNYVSSERRQHTTSDNSHTSNTQVFKRIKHAPNIISSRTEEPSLDGKTRGFPWHFPSNFSAKSCPGDRNRRGSGPKSKKDATATTHPGLIAQQSNALSGNLADITLASYISGLPFRQIYRFEAGRKMECGPTWDSHHTREYVHRAAWPDQSG